MNENLVHGGLKSFIITPLKDLVVTKQHLVYVEIAHYANNNPNELIKLCEVALTRKQAIQKGILLIKAAFKC